MNRIIHLFTLITLLILTGCATPLFTESQKSQNRLGTQWGEDIHSEAHTVKLKRITQKPIEVIEIHYSNTEVPGNSLNMLSLADGDISMSIVNQKGKPLDITQNKEILHLQGTIGESYQLSYKNNSTDMIYEILTTVDGLDVIRGTAGSFKNYGYSLLPGQTLMISGFRKSNLAVAAFRFSNIENSYAAQNSTKNIYNTGIIGTAIFPLLDPNQPKQTEVPYSVAPRAFPHEKRYAPSPNYRKR